MKCKIDGCGSVSDRRGLCQKHAWRLRVHGDPYYTPYMPKLCTVAGCGRKHKGHGYCQKHLSRSKRGLSLVGLLRTLNPKRYRQIKRPQHPLAMKNGCVLLHRYVLFEQIGFVRVPCFWCGNPLEWKKNLHVDHKDHDRRNNSPTNLVPACNSCNAGRMLHCAKPRVSMYS